jgi:hypothetical protein
MHLITTEKAYSPATARNINSFHVIFETLALLLYIPRFPCAFRGACGTNSYFGLLHAALGATLGDNRESAFGRFVLGLSFLRAFGLVRHWKQMWVKRTFDKDSGDKSCALQPRVSCFFPVFILTFYSLLHSLAIILW